MSGVLSVLDFTHLWQIHDMSLHAVEVHQCF